MSSDITISIIEVFISLVIESILLATVFQYISTKQIDKTEMILKNEMANIEKQNKFDFEQIQTAIKNSRDDVINEIKERRSKP